MRLGLPGRADRFWTIFLLAHLAFAQPLFELFGRQAEFLVAHDVNGLKLVAFAFLLGLVTPALLATLASAFKAQAMFRVLGFALTFLVLAPALNRADLSGFVFMFAGATGAALVLFLHARFTPVRLFFKVFSLAAPVFIYLFLFHSRAEPLLWVNQEGVSEHQRHFVQTPDIVFLVLDEFPLVSLLTADLQINAARYPNFAELARSANWYIDATTGAEVTVDAVPEALTGQRAQASDERLPIAIHHPNNLFTLLAGKYQITAQETATLLCPRSACGQAEQSLKFTERRGGLILDTVVVWAHLITPLPWANELPSVSDGWTDFGKRPQLTQETGNELQEALAKAGLSRQMGWETRGDQFRAFIEHIEPRARPQLHYLHSLLPHRVWRYLPDGRQYLVEEVWAALDPPGPKPKQLNGSVFGHEWQNDRWAVQIARLRHLLQVQYVDTLLGDLIRHLREQGTYDNTLLVLIGDHGASFIPGEGRRAITQRSLTDISAVPMFIKLPGQKEGDVIENNARLVDILPTIADILGAEPLWDTDGHSLLDPQHPRPANIEVKNSRGDMVRYPASQHMDHLRKRAASQQQEFGRDSRIPAIGPHAQLLGHPIADLDIGADSPLQVRLDAPQLLSNVRPDARFIPLHMSGRIEPPLNVESPRALAISNDGRIVAVTQTYDVAGYRDQFEFLLKPSDLHAGSNRFEYFLVYGSDNELSLSRLGSGDASPPRLEMDDRGTRITGFRARDLWLDEKRGGRVLTQSVEGGGLISLHGTATATDSSFNTLLVFLDGRYAARAEARDGLYQVPLPVTGSDHARQIPLRAFEVTTAGLREVRYPPECSPDWAFAPPASWSDSQCASASESPLQSLADGSMGANLDFRIAGIRSYLDNGWEVEPGNLTWSTGQQASLHIPLPEGVTSLHMSVSATPFLAPPRLNVQTVFLFANNQQVAKWILDEARLTELECLIPQSVLRQSPGMLKLQFLTPDAASPATLGTGGDLRVLGIGISELRLNSLKEKNGPEAAEQPG